MSASSTHQTLAALERLDASQLAIFLDVDGTLLEIAETPETVVVPPTLLELLDTLSSRAGGAVALVSGRSIAALDSLFAPLVLPSAGLHGFERRDAMGALWRHALPEGSAVDLARRELGSLVERHEGLLLEDKQFAIAVHYRLAPELESAVIRAVEAVAGEGDSGLSIQRGRMVVELRPSSASKGTAVREFMTEAPFCGRVPLCFGDDLTDESAFASTNELGGISVAVNVSRPTLASAHLPSVPAVRDWLHSIARSPV